MAKGQMPKIRGALCYIAVDVRDICNFLPKNSQSSGIILVKLKKKLAFNGHVYFQPVCTQKVLDALIYLKNNNKFYSNIQINMENLPPALCDLDEDEEIRIELANESNSEGEEESL